MRIGEAFANLHPASPRHLWFFVAGPDRDGSMVAFNFTSAKDGCDQTCVVQAGEHPFVAHQTVVAYRRGRLFSTKAYAAIKSLGCYEPWADLSAGLLLRIQQGAIASPGTTTKLKTMVRQSLGIQSA